MILTITPNPAMDMTYEVRSMRPGEVHRVVRVHRRAGGKGINVSRVLRQMGVPTRAITTAGGTTGMALLDDLAASGIPHEVVHVPATTRLTMTVTVTGGDARPTAFNEPGEPPGAESLAELARVTRDHLGEASVLVCSGSLPAGTPPTFYAELVGLAHERGVPAIVDASGAALLHAVRAGADVVKPNLEELRAVSEHSDPLTAIHDLQQLGSSTVVASLGADGLLAVVGEDAYSARLPYALSGNATGGGDAAVAALAHGFEANMPWPERLRMAVAWSAGTVAHATAGSVIADIAEKAVGDARVERLHLT